jgi:hypothetical protein
MLSGAGMFLFVFLELNLSVLIHQVNVSDRFFNLSANIIRQITDSTVPADCGRLAGRSRICGGMTFRRRYRSIAFPVRPCRIDLSLHVTGKGLHDVIKNRRGCTLPLVRVFGIRGRGLLGKQQHQHAKERNLQAFNDLIHNACPVFQMTRYLNNSFNTL